MSALILHSHLKSLQLIERLVGVQASAIGGITRFNAAPLFLGLEAMAQLAALHVRHLVHFERHAFLLKVTLFDFPDVKALMGEYFFQANLISQSTYAFDYRINSQASGQGNLAAELIIGTQNYDGHFKREYLQEHYQKRFNQLLNGE